MFKPPSLRRISSRLPIRWRLALVSFGLFALLLAAFGLQIAYAEQQTLLSNQAIALREHARLAQLSRVLPVAPTPLPPIGPFPQTLSDAGSIPNEFSSSPAEGLAQVFSGPTIRATVISADGAILASGNGNSLAPPAVKISSAAIQQALITAPQLSDYLLTPDGAGPRQLIVLLPIVLAPGDDAALARTVGVLALSTPTEPIDRAVATTRLDLIPGIGVALALAAAIILPLMRVALRPLTEMERASTQIAQGALSLRLQEPPTRDEIGRLALAFNSMVAQLEATFARQKQFVADASHELRTPITVLGGNLEMLLLGANAGDTQAARRLLQNMYAEVERMRRLVEDLLTLTRVDEGRLQLRLERIDLAALCADLCEQARQLAYGQTVACAAALDVPPIVADRDRLRQVLLNVLENALKYTPPTGHIRLLTRREARQAIIEVRDTGAGIQPEALPSVFERFYRADPARERRSQQKGGAGLGLAIAKSLVEAHGGQIAISSTPGQGTTVTIHLPLAEQEADIDSVFSISSENENGFSDEPVMIDTAEASQFDARPVHLDRHHHLIGVSGGYFMDTAFAALGRFVVRFRYLIVVAWIAITIFCVIAFPSLGSVIKSATISDFLPTSAPSIQAAQLAAPFQNTQYASATIVAVRENGPLTTADQAAIDRLENLVRAMPAVKLVRDLSVSSDGAARQAQVQAAVPPNGTGTGAALVSRIRDAFGQVNAPAMLTFHLTGQLATNVDTQNAQNASQNATQNFTYLLIIVLLLVAFRALLAPLLTLIPAAVVLALSSPVIAGAVTRLGVQVSPTTQIVLIVLVLGAGTDYGLFLTFRVREELRRGLTSKAAVVRAVQTVGETITFSALTVIVALSTLVIAQFGIYQSLGPALAIGIALMLLAGLTLLPALLAIFGRAVFWPTSTAKRENVPAGLWGRLTGRLIQRPVLTFSLGVVLFVGLALGQFGTTQSGFSGQTGGPAGADSTVGTAAIAAHYPNTNQNPTQILLLFPQSVWNNPDSLATAQQGLMKIFAIRTVLGPLNPTGVPFTAARLAQLHTQLGAPQALPAVPPATSGISPREYNAYRATGQYISADGQTVQFLAILNDTSASPAAIDAIPALRTAVAQVATATGASQNGIFSRNALAYDITQTSQSDLSHIIPIVAVLIAVLLALVLRSLIAPLYLVASVVLSYLAAWGLVALIFVHLGGSDGVNFVLPFILFVFLMALGSDYNILVMSRIREEAQHKPLRQAVHDAIARTGGTVTAAGMILAGTFAVLAVTANQDQTRQLGFGVAAGILMDTFLIRTLLIPALVVLLGKWNWWPSRLFRRAISSEVPEAQVEQAVSLTES